MLIVIASFAHFLPLAHIQRGAQQNEWNKIWWCASKYQKEQAEKLVKASGVIVPDTGCSIKEVEKFQQYYSLFDVVIVVYLFKNFARGYKHLYDGAEFVHNAGNDVRYTFRLMYYEDKKHYQPIVNLLAAFGSQTYCVFCNLTYTRQENHKRPQTCSHCMQYSSCEINQSKIECTQ